MDTYKKGDYIAVMTNQPNIHFLEMFGHGLSIDNVKPSKYVGKIMNVHYCPRKSVNNLENDIL